MVNSSTQEQGVCEVLNEALGVCGQPAVMRYQAMGGGFMHLCARHGASHQLYCERWTSDGWKDVGGRVAGWFASVRGDFRTYTRGYQAGYKRSSRDAYIQRLIGKGYVEIGRSGTIVATPAGVDALGSDYEPRPTGEALQDYWLQRLPPGEAAVLKLALRDHPHGVPRDIIDHETGYRRSSRDAYIQRLQARQLLEKGGGPVTASAVLFES